MTYITSYYTQHIPEYLVSLSVEAQGTFLVVMKTSLLILFLSCFNGIFGSWVYSQRPYFHWIKSKLNCKNFSLEQDSVLDLSLNNLKKESPAPPPARAVTPRSSEILGDQYRRQKPGGQRPSFSSFFSQGSLDTEARSRGG